MCDCMGRDRTTRPTKQLGQRGQGSEGRRSQPSKARVALLLRAAFYAGSCPGPSGMVGGCNPPSIGGCKSAGFKCIDGAMLGPPPGGSGTLG